MADAIERMLDETGRLRREVEHLLESQLTSKGSALESHLSTAADALAEAYQEAGRMMVDEGEGNGG